MLNWAFAAKEMQKRAINKPLKLYTNGLKMFLPDEHKIFSVYELETIENSIIMPGCSINGDFTIKDSIIAFNSEISKSDTPDKIFLLGEGTKISL